MQNEPALYQTAYTQRVLWLLLPGLLLLVGVSAESRAQGVPANSIDVPRLAPGAPNWTPPVAGESQLPQRTAAASTQTAARQNPSQPITPASPGSGVSQPGQGKPPNGSSRGTSWMTTLASLAFVTTLLILCAKVGQKYLRGGPNAQAARIFDVLARQRLDSRHALTLVRCGGRLLVLSESQHGLQMVTEICDPDEVDLLVKLCQTPENDNAGSSAFLNLLRPALSGGNPSPTAGETSATRGSRTDEHSQYGQSPPSLATNAGAYHE